jgi:hypothetical protein
MIDVNRPRTFLSLFAVALLVSLASAASAAPVASPLALQVPPGEPPVVDPNAPPPETPPPPAAPLGGMKLEGNGASLKLGLLFQPSYEVASGSLQPAPASNQTNQSFYLRRMRLMVGLTFGSQIEFFFETDSPHLGHNVSADTSAGRSSIGMKVQDAFMTWKPMDEFKLDGGLLLVPFSHNSVQGATTLYGLDYFESSFLQSGALGNFAGRDVGVQARGLVIGHLEYRLAVLTGHREVLDPMMLPMTPQTRSELRIAGRVQYNVFDPETAYFYAGTYAGTKNILSFGAAVDHQDAYTAFDVDAFADIPVGGGNVVTGQAAVLHYDGGSWLKTVPKQTDFVIEGGFRLGALKISPILRFEEQMRADTVNAMGDTVAGVNYMYVSAGVAWWPFGHNLNVKAFYTYVKPPINAYNQFNLQVQLYVF